MENPGGKENPTSYTPGVVVRVSTSSQCGFPGFESKPVDRFM
jgi:hypothetical protein